MENLVKVGFVIFYMSSMHKGFFSKNPRCQNGYYLSQWWGLFCEEINFIKKIASYFKFFKNHLGNQFFFLQIMFVHLMLIGILLSTMYGIWFLK